MTAADFSRFERVLPLGPTELTGFLQVDLDGAGGPLDFQTLAQLDGEPFVLVGGVSQSVLTAAEFLF